MNIADVDGVKVAGVLFDAGTKTIRISTIGAMNVANIKLTK